MAWPRRSGHDRPVVLAEARPPEPQDITWSQQTRVEQIGDRHAPAVEQVRRARFL
jgi:hypothetical protein